MVGKISQELVKDTSNICKPHLRIRHRCSRLQLIVWVPAYAYLRRSSPIEVEANQYLFNWNTVSNMLRFGYCITELLADSGGLVYRRCTGFGRIAMQIIAKRRQPS